VLTKPNLLTEATTQQVVKELVLGSRNTPRLSYCLAKSCGADDHRSAASDLIALENAFFNRPAWCEVLSFSRYGIELLKARPSSLLMSISEQENTHVKAEVAKQPEQCRRASKSMGPSRIHSSTQRMYLRGLGTRFQAVRQCALNHYYYSESVFAKKSNLKLVIAITKMKWSFAKTFWKAGHKRQVWPEWSDRVCCDGIYAF
jgi:hypothetical protein